MEAFLAQIRGATFSQHTTQNVWGPGQQRIGHCHIEVLSLPRSLAAEERHENADQRTRSQGDIGHGQSREGRSTARSLAEAQHTGEGLSAKVVRGSLAEWARLPERRQRTVDDARRLLLHRLIPKPETVHDTRAERLDKDVGLRGQAEEDLSPLVVFEIEGEAELPALRVTEIDRVPGDPRAQLAGRLALVALDLDHLGPVIGHQHGEVRPGEEAREIQYPNPG